MPEIIVIGAGAAGLCAARILSEAGMDTLVLEARDRIGGRIHTISDRLSPVPVELGAEFVHGRSPILWDALRSVALPAQEISGARWCFDGQTRERCDDSFEDFEQVFGPMRDAPEQSFADFLKTLNVPAELKQLATAYVEGFNAARGELISIQSLVQGEEAGDTEGLYRLPSGYGALMDRLYARTDPARVKWRFRTVVKSIRWRPGQVEVATNFGIFRARRAILTLPLGVLVAGAVTFEPEPEVLSEARRALAVGQVVRIVYRFRRSLWEERYPGLAFWHSNETWMPTWWTMHPLDAPVIVGWMAGRDAEEHALDEPDALAQRGIATLARLLDCDREQLTGELECWHTHNWCADPFARGAYSYVRVNGLDAQRRFGEPVEGTLFFAGEAVNADGHVGTVHGAMASGERAARLAL